MLTTALSLMTFAIIALLLGALYLGRRGGAGKQVALMLVLAIVMAINLAIWTLPGPDGAAPMAQNPEQRPK
ncbi:MAG: hypothetical protein ABIR23_01770 [Novosphingobium sp.]